MEAEDKVVSEVYNTSVVPLCKSLTTGEDNKLEQLVAENNFLKRRENVLEQQFPERKSKECLFSCFLGSNGQVVLRNPDIETVLSRFEFSYPYSLLDKSPKIDDCFIPTVDEDGDLKVKRRKDLVQKDGVILIEHQSATTLDLVGEQVWRGALFLADFILDNPLIFKGAKVLEVAAGVGLTSVVAAILAKKVIVTDVDKGSILDLIERNMNRNQELFAAETHLKEIDFFDHRTITDIGSLKDDTNILLAADVVYHNQLTDAFLDTILCLMKEKPNKVLFVALEKRYVFTLEDMDTVAPCYDHFVSGLEWLRNQETSRVDWEIEQIQESFPQYFTYERTKELVLWKIKAIVK